MTILPLAYLGSTEWFLRLLEGDCIVDVGENWVKQSARNRCEILSSGGVATLTVPVHGSGRKIRTKDIRIDNSKRWQHQHWGSMVSAYRNSPFFDHYEERFAPFYEHHFEFMSDLNMGLTETILNILDVENVLKISENYVEAAPGDIDLRGKKSLRRVNSCTPDLRYTQVFSDRTDFLPALSIIDLLFCESGQTACQMLHSCQR